MNNVVVSGKTMENIRNNFDVRLATNKIDYLNWASKPSYVIRKIFDSNLVAIPKIKTVLMLNRPA